MSLVSIKKSTIVVWEATDGERYQSQPLPHLGARMLITDLRRYGAKLLYVVRCRPRRLRWLRRETDTRRIS